MKTKISILLLAFGLLFIGCDKEPATWVTNIGHVTFWTSASTKGQITVFVKDINRGTITSAYAPYNPTCGAAGCVNFDIEEGTYVYQAISVSTGIQWSGYITVIANQCNLMCLN